MTQRRGPSWSRSIRTVVPGYIRRVLCIFLAGPSSGKLFLMKVFNWTRKWMCRCVIGWVMLGNSYGGLWIRRCWWRLMGVLRVPSFFLGWYAVGADGRGRSTLSGRGCSGWGCSGWGWSIILDVEAVAEPMVYYFDLFFLAFWLVLDMEEDLTSWLCGSIVRKHPINKVLLPWHNLYP